MEQRHRYTLELDPFDVSRSQWSELDSGSKLQFLVKHELWEIGE